MLARHKNTEVNTTAKQTKSEDIETQMFIRGEQKITVPVRRAARTVSVIEVIPCGVAYAIALA